MKLLIVDDEISALFVFLNEINSREWFRVQVFSR